MNLLTERKLSDNKGAHCSKAGKVRGFTAYIGGAILPEAKNELEKCLQYVLSNSFSVGKITRDPQSDQVTYSSGWSHKINADSKEFEGTEFLAALGQHIPDKYTQTVRYYGMYSNKMRGSLGHGSPTKLVCGRRHISLEHSAGPTSKL